jgi:hypothetical protein
VEKTSVISAAEYTITVNVPVFEEKNNKDGSKTCAEGDWQPRDVLWKLVGEIWRSRRLSKHWRFNEQSQVRVRRERFVPKCARQTKQKV